MPTALAAAQIDSNKIDSRKLEGSDLLSLSTHEFLFWEHEGNRAVRSGQWKLVAKENQPWELYDINADRTEMNNLAAKYPDKVEELAARWDAWAARTNVLPRPGN
jgi:arylsulfatase